MNKTEYAAAEMLPPAAPETAALAYHQYRQGQYYSAEMSDFERVNASITEGFQRHQHTAATRKSHYFQGRFENIYLPASLTPGMDAVLGSAKAHAQQILGVSQPLRAGHWFNAMQPGDVTLPHSHDDDQELLAAVYYLAVPPRSGDLLLGEGKQTVRITPRAGQFIFFTPEQLHAVDLHRGCGLRLSVAMNLGL